ncbi:MAG: ASKHA domain-containing protein [Clostridia bacterium]|nr:ASKHA domain-containing protein [Clostridia bacterium]
MSNVIQIPESAVGQRLTAFLSAAHHAVSADCGGRGVCGKCRVRVISGTFYEDETLTKPIIPDENGYILSCRAYCSGVGASIEIPDTEGSGLTAFAAAVGVSENQGTAGFGVALDIGTTTLAAALVDRASGDVLASVSCLNPQRSFGADVMSRITASCEHLDDLQAVLLGAVRKMTTELTEKVPGCVPDTLYAVGNPTMLHLFLGVDPTSMGTYPFTPAFVEERTVSGASLDLPFTSVTVLPSAAAFIGSDITAGAAVCGMADTDDAALLIDIGTNGEMLLSTGSAHGNRLLAASAAAGPAMEGAGISCGVGGIPGAVCAVRDNGTITFETVGKAAPVGICGSGLIDLIAVLLDKELIDETGYLDDDPFVLYEDPTIPGGGELSLTQEDVRQFQLAKSAIRAGAEALLAEAGMEAEDVKHVYIAGGLGYYMNIPSAIRSGLLPECFSSTASAVGNSALAGAIHALCGKDFQKTVSRIAEHCGVLELNSSAVFNEGFIEHMMFPENE